jgi:CubicO group peptidase (beta-lactamase class C family)
VTWDSLDARMKWEADQGFSGVLLVARDGKTAFHKAYGMANREKRIAMRPDTILAIGSTPIDFTKAAILLLAERSKLSLTDPITKHFDEVPKDLKSVTIAHLMTGRSGLPDFHHLPTDRNRVHSWIDRAEAVRRILYQKPFLGGVGHTDEVSDGVVRVGDLLEHGRAASRRLRGKAGQV